MKRNPILIIVCGRPGSGKSTLAKRISDDLSIPYFSKDEFKELLFDTLGYSDQKWSTECNVPSYALIYLLAEKLLAAGSNVLIESNFSRKYDEKRIAEILNKTKAKEIQILCSADKEVLFERFKNRVLSGERHPGHNDDKDFSLIKEKHFTDEYEPLSLSRKSLVYDTTYFSEDNYKSLLKSLRSLIEDDRTEEVKI